ncbi:MAG: hypothetical protein RIK87_06205 [Fuerstiella sp.]
MDLMVTLAYLDPGTGSMLLQALVGGSAGLMVLVRHLYRSWKYRGTATASARNEQ